MLKAWRSDSTASAMTMGDSRVATELEPAAYDDQNTFPLGILQSGSVVVAELGAYLGQARGVRSCRLAGR